MSNGFHIGQKVVCITSRQWSIIPSKGIRALWWVATGRRKNVGGPVKGDNLRIISFNQDGYLGFSEWRQTGHYDPLGFRPLQEDSASEKLARDEAQRADRQELQEQTQPA